jgi:hypothetical protein
VIPAYMLWSLAVIAFLVASFLAWSDAKIEIARLGGDGSPKLKILCGVNVPQSRVPAQLSVLTQAGLVVAGQRVWYFRLVLESISQSPLKNCCGCIREIRRNGSMIMQNELLYLKFVRGDNEDESRKTINYGMPAQLDVLLATETNQVKITTPGFILPTSSNYSTLFSPPGIYSIHVVIAGDDMASIACELEFNWTGQWDTADLRLIKSSMVSIDSM